MAVSPRTITRLALAGGFAAAVLVAPAVATVHAVETPGTSHAACPTGESEDLYTTTCMPDLVPNSPSPFGTVSGNPDLPAIDGIPCGGRQSGQCVGLAEEQQSQTTLMPPHTSVSSSP